MEFFAIMVFLLLCSISLVSYNLDSGKSLDMRKKQSSKSLRNSTIKKTVEDSFESGASYSKKFRIESMCSQAGLKMKYGEYKVLCVLTSLILPVMSYSMLKNEFLTIVSIPLGLTVPGQIIMFKRNRRMAVLEKQIGSFLQMVTERYANTKDFAKAIEDCVEDFKGAEPFYTELRDTVLEIQLGVSTIEAIKNLAVRTGNKYLHRLGDYYSLTLNLGTTEARNTLLKQSFLQYEENRKIKMDLQKSISGPANEAYIMIAFIPVTMIYNASTNADYIPFMTETVIGKVGVAFIFTVVVGCMWLVSSKISAPIE